MADEDWNVEEILAREAAFSAAEDDVKRLEELLASGGRVTMADWAGRTPLHAACASNAGGAIELLVRLGADASALDQVCASVRACVCARACAAPL